MAVIDIECNVKNLVQYFNRDTFVEVTNDIKSEIKTSKEIMSKYFKPKFKNELMYRGNRYSPSHYLNKADIIIFDNYNHDLFLGIKSKTLMLEHCSPKKIKQHKIDETLILEKIEKAQQICGIEKIERNVINTLRFYFPIDAYKREWIVDLDFAYNSSDFDLALNKEGDDILIFATLIKDQMVILYADDSKESIKKLQPKATYRDGNPQVMKLIPGMIKKGDSIAEIFVCDKGIAVKKKTGVIWFVLD